jgi:DNA-binding transcriptional LysR family regulator
MNLEHLRAFLEVAATGNFNRAADRLNVTQSTVSARIKSLEDQLDRVLFLRNRNGAQLTAAGHHIHRYVELSVRAWEQARQEVALPAELKQSFGLGIQFNLWERLVPGWLGWMRRHATDTALRIEADYSQSLTRQVAQGLLDLAVLYMPRNMPGLAIETLLVDTLVLVSTEPRVTSIAWVEDYVFVDWGDEYRGNHSLAFPKMQAPAISVGLSAIGLNHILTHGGSGYFIEHSVAPLIAEGRLYRAADAPSFSRPAYLVRAAESPHPELVELALEGLRAAAEGPSASEPDESRTGLGSVCL